MAQVPKCHNLGAGALGRLRGYLMRIVAYADRFGRDCESNVSMSWHPLSIAVVTL